MAQWRKTTVLTLQGSTKMWDWRAAHFLLYSIIRLKRGYICHSYLGGKMEGLHMATAPTLKEAKWKCDRDFQRVQHTVNFIQHLKEGT